MHHAESISIWEKCNIYLEKKKKAPQQSYWAPATKSVFLRDKHTDAMSS